MIEEALPFRLGFFCLRPIMNYIDTHSHLYSEEFLEDIDQVILRAKEAKVAKIILPNIDVDSIEQMISLSKKDNCFYPTLGLHPTSVDSNYLSQLKNIELYLQKVKIYAIGEIGIDLYWDKTYVNEQIHAFETQVQWAIDLDLPLIIHIRKGFEQTFESLGKLKDNLKSSNKKFSGVFHCFSGDRNQAKKAIEMGFKIGIGGVVTFKNASLAQIASEIDLKDIVLETDAPYLPPVPYRGMRNESSYIPIIAQKISEIKNIDIEEVASVTTKSAEEVFFLN